MAWTSPKTFTSGSVLTAAELNTHLRDNLNETCAATVTTAGDLTYADAANSMGSRLAIGTEPAHIVVDGSTPVWRTVDGGFQSTAQVTSSTSFVSGALPSVTLTTGTRALVLVTSSWVTNDTAGGTCLVSCDVSGATTIASSDSRSGFYEAGSANDRGTAFIPIFYGEGHSSLTAGSNTFQMEIRVTAGSGTFDNNSLIVIPFD